MSSQKYSSKDVYYLLTFLEPLDGYDREETISARCAETDVDDRASIRRLIDKEFFKDPWYSRIDLSTKLAMSTALLNAISDDGFDFEWLTIDADGTFSLPARFGIGRAKILYQEIYRAVFDHWGDELKEAGMLLVPPDALEIPGL